MFFDYRFPIIRVFLVPIVILRGGGSGMYIICIYKLAGIVLVPSRPFRAPPPTAGSQLYRLDIQHEQ